MNCIQLSVHLLPFCILCVFGLMSGNEDTSKPKFRILAPQFICPEDKNSAIVKADNTIITLQTEPGANLTFSWKVQCEWNAAESPAQVHTLALWKTIRRLEKRLNEPPAEPGLYIINHAPYPLAKEEGTQLMLLKGVLYMFYVTATDGRNKQTEKSFIIDVISEDDVSLNTKENKLISIVLIGSEIVYKDMEYLAEAIVNSCEHLSDYYFRWMVSSDNYQLDVTDIKGSRMEIPANTLKPGQTYSVICQVLAYSSEKVIAEDRLKFLVLHREFNLYFNVDLLVVTVNTPFKIQASIDNIDFSLDEINIFWTCFLNDDFFDDFEYDHHGWLIFPYGLPKIGEYIVSITAETVNMPGITSASTRIVTEDAKLPVIEVALTSRRPVEDSEVSLSAFVSGILPGCTITWYFIKAQCTYSSRAKNSDHSCPEDQRGVPLGTPESFLSLEQTYLNEMTDFSNLTFERSIDTTIRAEPGTATILAECECSMQTNAPCTKGTAYAELDFKVNKKPGGGAVQIKIQPDSGIAMTTIYRLSTRAVLDADRPLLYTFYCDLGNNDSLVLGTYLDYTSVETMLPYVDGGTAVWVEVCDSEEACSVSKPKLVWQLPGEASTINELMNEIKTYVRRCETGWLLRLATTAIMTYYNAAQTIAFMKFTDGLEKSLHEFGTWCFKQGSEDYRDFIHWLEEMMTSLTA